MSQLRVLYLLRQNIKALLEGRRQNQTELAFWMRRNKSWINKFLNGTRELRLRDLDRIADFFGIPTYQLFHPGISPLTERRKGHDRRAGRDRRIGLSGRQVQSVAADVASARQAPSLTPKEIRWLERLRALAPEQRRNILQVLGALDPGEDQAEPPQRKSKGR